MVRWGGGRLNRACKYICIFNRIHNNSPKICNASGHLRSKSATVYISSLCMYVECNEPGFKDNISYKENCIIYAMKNIFLLNIIFICIIFQINDFDVENAVFHKYVCNTYVYVYSDDLNCSCRQEFRIQRSINNPTTFCSRFVTISELELMHISVSNIDFVCWNITTTKNMFKSAELLYVCIVYIVEPLKINHVSIGLIEKLTL